MSSRKYFIRKIIAVFIFCMLFLFSLIFYSNELEKNLNNDIKSKLKEVSAQNCILINSELNSKMNALIEISERISCEDDKTVEEKLDSLQSTAERYRFKRMGIIDKNGMSPTTDGHMLDLKYREYYTKSFEGQTIVSKKYKDLIDNENIIAFSTPIYSDGEIDSVLFAIYSTNSLQEVLNVNFFNDEGYFYIVDKYGNVIVNSAENSTESSIENVFDQMFKVDKRNFKVIEEIKNNFDTDTQKYFSFYNEGEKFMYFSQLGINDWYVLNIVGEDVIASNKNFIMNLTYLLCFIITLIFVCLLFYIIKNEKNKNEKLREIAYVDSLTGGYSYQRFLEEARKKLDKNPDKNAAFIVMDIDGFKIINELYGYDVGDSVLKHIWETWITSINKEDETFARRIADRFVALLYYETKEALQKRLEEINSKVQTCFIKDSKGYILRPKMGVYLIKNKNENPQSMQNYAVMAYSKIKGKNDGDISFYFDEYSQQIIKNKFIEDDMEYAYTKKEFIVYYQPKYDAVSKKISGAEALVRWKKSTGEIISPGVFIPVAENNGFITKLDEYVFAEVCNHQKKLLDLGIEPVPVSVNVSQKHLYYDRFVKTYIDIIDNVGIDAKYVQLEITESAMFENRHNLISIIDELHNYGFKILMDDFGTGYSSLMMLKSIPIDVMKLDKSFVDDYNEEKGQMIIKCVIQLAKEMNISITAEGVETEEQYKFLKELECNDIQGYYFAKPMPETDYAKVLKDN